MRLGGVARHNLCRRPLRTSLTILGIAVAVAGFHALIGLSRGVERAWMGNFQERGTHILALRKGAVEILATSLDESLGTALAAAPGVAAAAGELVDLLPLTPDRITLVTGWPSGSFLWKTLRLDAGRLPEAGEDDAVVLGKAVAAALDRKPGTSLAVLDRSLRVVGICRPAGPMSNHSVIMPLATLQGMLNKRGLVTGVNIALQRPDDPAAVQTAVDRLSRGFPGLSFTETAALADENHVLRLLRALSWGMSAIAVLMAVVVVMNTLFMSVAERTREIAVLGAVGWTWKRIGALIFLEGLLLTALGGGGGILLGMALLRALASSTPLAGYIEPDTDGGLLALAFACLLVLGVLGSLLPALRAARLNVADGLRHE